METCIFCDIVKRLEPAFIVYEDDKFMAFLDKYPQTRGHLQLVPKIHYTWVYDMLEIGEFFTTAQRIIHAIIPVLRADHVTLLTLGHQIKHAHLWIVPQYKRFTKIEEIYRNIGNESEMKNLAQILKDSLGGGVT